MRICTEAKRRFESITASRSAFLRFTCRCAIWFAAVALVVGGGIYGLRYWVMDAETTSLSRAFADFYESLRNSRHFADYGASGNIYTPLSVVLLVPFTWLCPDIAGCDTCAAAFRLPGFWIALVLYLALSIALLVPLVRRLARTEGRAGRMLAVTAVLSAPVVFAAARGNLVFAALICTLLFLLWYDSPSRWRRELALVALAAAGVLKIYPLIFGCFLLNRRRFFDSARVAFYTAALFILPFFFFDGGLENLRVFFCNLYGFGYGGDRNLAVSNISLVSTWSKLLHLIGLPFGASLEQTAAGEIAGDALTCLLFVLCCVIGIGVRDDLFRALACGTAVCMVPAASYFYSLCFFLPALCFLVRDFDRLPPRCRRLSGGALWFFCLALFIIPFYPVQAIWMCGLVVCLLRIFVSERRAAAAVLRQGEPPGNRRSVLDKPGTK